MSFQELNIQDVGCNPFAVFGQMWALVSAGNDSAFNMMTVSWGGLGTLWDKSVATIYIRPQRYTKKFIDAADDFAVSFFSPQYKRALEICGTTSGKDTNKVEASGLTPVQLGEIMTFEEANLVLTCHKLFAQEFQETSFLNPALLDRVYPKRDLHTMYVGEVTHIHGNPQAQMPLPPHGHPHPHR